MFTFNPEMAGEDDAEAGDDVERESDVRNFFYNIKVYLSL